LILAWSRNFMGSIQYQRPLTMTHLFRHCRRSGAPPRIKVRGRLRGEPGTHAHGPWSWIPALPRLRPGSAGMTNHFCFDPEAARCGAPSPGSGGGRRLWLRSRHAAGGAPALERGPDRSLEPEAVDRRRALERADAVEPDPGPLEAAFLQHPPRGRVGDARAGLQRLELEILERVLDQRAHRLGGVAATPIGYAEPDAELRRGAGGARPLAQLEPAGADQRPVGERDRERPLRIRAVGCGEKCLGILARIGMRDARGVLRDAALVREHRDLLHVLETRRAQHEPLGL